MMNKSLIILNRNKTRIIFFCSYGLLIGLNGCASISSEMICSHKESNISPMCNEEKQVAVDDGIVYYMPQRPIRVNVNVEDLSDSNTPPASSDKVRKSNSIFTPISADTKPKKKITVTVVNNYSEETFPDTENIFLLRYNKNLIGNNNMAVGINNNGLLSVTHADTINKINDIVTNIAIDAAAISMGTGFIPSSNASSASRANALPTIAEIKGPTFQSPSLNSITYNGIITDCENANYSHVYNPGKSASEAYICGIEITFNKLAGNPGLNNSIRINEPKFLESPWVNTRHFFRKARNFLDVIHTQNTLESVPGIFYKQDLPYEIKVHKKNRPVEETTSLVAFSPNESKIYFAPITETVFTDNTSDVTLINGVVNSLKENTDSELLAMSKIPSGILGAYTDAIGQIFSSLGKVALNQKTNDTNQLGALLEAIKIQRCQKAIALNNTAGKTGDALSSAYSNIVAACSE